MSTCLAGSAAVVERPAADAAGLRDSATAATMSSRCTVALTESGIQFRRTLPSSKGPEPMLKIAGRAAGLADDAHGKSQWI
jgi:hypothetical protein